MALVVNVPHEALVEFCGLIDGFKAGIVKECNDLNDALIKLKTGSSAEFINQIENSIGQVEAVVDNSQTALQELSQKVFEYERLVYRLKAIARAYDSSVLPSALKRREAVLQSNPRNLSNTQYGFEPIKIWGQTYVMYNKPLETARILIRKQGKNSREMCGTCGICQCANILHMAGVTDVTEDDLINEALCCSKLTMIGLDIDNSDPDNRGGTSASGRREILSRFNLETYTYSITNNRDTAISYFAQQISSGHGVIVTVDAGLFWKDTNLSEQGHAISLISVSESGDSFIYCDTGTGSIDVISATRLSEVLTGRPANITTNIIR